MFFNSYDGWNVLKSTSGRLLILAIFTKYDGNITRYNIAALRDKAKNPPPAMRQTDVQLLQQAIEEGPRFFYSYAGWQEIECPNAGKTLAAEFKLSSGSIARYNRSELDVLTNNPPAEFSAYDRAAVGVALTTAPTTPFATNAPVLRQEASLT